MSTRIPRGRLCRVYDPEGHPTRYTGWLTSYLGGGEAVGLRARERHGRLVPYVAWATCVRPVEPPTPTWVLDRSLTDPRDADEYARWLDGCAWQTAEQLVLYGYRVKCAPTLTCYEKTKLHTFHVELSATEGDQPCPEYLERLLSGLQRCGTFNSYTPSIRGHSPRGTW